MTVPLFSGWPAAATWPPPPRSSRSTLLRWQPPSPAALLSPSQTQLFRRQAIFRSRPKKYLHPLLSSKWGRISNYSLSFSPRCVTFPAPILQLTPVRDCLRIMRNHLFHASAFAYCQLCALCDNILLPKHPFLLLVPSQLLYRNIK